jgi:hypothetical protein
MTIENKKCEWFLVSLASVVGHLSMPWRLRMLVISLKKLRVLAADEIQPIVNLW